VFDFSYNLLSLWGISEVYTLQEAFRQTKNAEKMT